ncbi:Methyltransferase domain-containing protein [Andreprevotia lacus DSM 23236]|jgi:SAM-dependent methyltransferase|uniref:Methyltransferase domain-containing protein n=2 Tax=Andreprevotia TaxID=397275 RepID=A0A1W1XZT4_9NEIS|nr:Methyltransferase domain-containing protein [Andreprevotia lacus DSM 23236]
MDSKAHWEGIYQNKATDAVSWYRLHLETSLRLIEAAAATPDAAIIDVGGGEATLVDDLLARGYTQLSVLDISQPAIARTQQRLGKQAALVNWIVADITQATLPEQGYDIWHDRAVFHFLTAQAQRDAYVLQLRHALKPDGHLLISTFGPDGPLQCSGLDIVRYDAEMLQRQFGPDFLLQESGTEVHRTPWGTEQQFVYCHLKRR